jgi:hypothetical protein
MQNQELSPLEPVHNLKAYKRVEGAHQVERFFRAAAELDVVQQQWGSPTTRSSVGNVTTLSNLLRMLYSRAGNYPRHQPLLYAESFSPNTPEGAWPQCHGAPAKRTS